MKKNYRGFGAIEGLLILVIVGLISFVGWYVWHSKNDTNSTLNNAANISAANTSRSVAASATSVLKISELGIQITVPSSLKDLTYSVEALSNLDKIATGDAATLSTRTLALADSNCAADVHKNALTGTDTGGPLGTIEKINGSPNSSYGSILLKESGYFIFFQNSQSGCSQLQSAQVIQAQGKEALANALGSQNAVTLIK